MERNRLDLADASVQASIQSVLQHVERQISDTLDAIRNHIDDNPDLRNKRDLLTSIDGIGERSAALLLAELGDPLRFASSRAITAFAELNPRLQESAATRARHAYRAQARLAEGRALHAGCLFTQAQPCHQRSTPASEGEGQDRQADRLCSDAQAAAHRLWRAEIGPALRSKTGPCQVKGKTVSTEVKLTHLGGCYRRFTSEEFQFPEVSPGPTLACLSAGSSAR